VAKLAAFLPFMNLVWGSYFGGPFSGTVALDAQGNVWITGFSVGNMLPDSSSSSAQSVPFVAELTPDGSALLNLVVSQFGGTAITSLPGGGVAILGPADTFLLTGPPSQPSFLTVTNSANNASSGMIAPEELISLYGAGIGPSSPLDGQIVGGVFATMLGGYQVLFNGAPAPLLYAGPNQINTVAPKELAGEKTASISVVGPQGSITFPTAFPAPSRPQIFSQIYSSGTYEGAYEAIAFNQDGTTNSTSNPAKPGSVLTIWVSGAGLTNDQSVDGAIVQAPGSTTELPVSLLPYPSSEDLTLKITYAGNPPGAIMGLVQINLLYPTPGFAGSVWFQVQIGNSVSGPVNVAVAAN
jgi:uncharacterized protein (TIGR03437 family)